MSAPRIALVDAFTRTAGEGNRAGVVVDPAGLDSRSMQAAARAVAASETAFVFPGDQGADFRFRYFTPAMEVPFCGHATVATFHYLAEAGRAACPGRYVFDCPAGRFEAEVESAEGAYRVWLATPQYPWTDSPLDKAELMNLLAGEIRMYDPELPVRRAGPKLFVPFSRREELFALQPRWQELTAMCRGRGLSGVFAFTREVVDPGSVAHGRFFAPAEGIREDPVTGAANGPLAAYLAMHGVLELPTGGGTVRARAEQGDAMGKPGRIELEVSGLPGRVDRVRIGGVGVTVIDGQLK